MFDRQTHTTERVSVASDGTEGNGVSSVPRFRPMAALWPTTAMPRTSSPATPTTPSDVFVFDRKTGTTERVSVASDGTEAKRTSATYPAISADGRYVAYASVASNLVPGDTNGVLDVFVFDRQTDTTERVSVASDGTEANGLSVRPAISADGRYVTYTSDASNLVPGDTNGAIDIFLFDRQTDTTERVSVASDGTEGERLAAACPRFRRMAAMSPTRALPRTSSLETPTTTMTSSWLQRIIGWYRSLGLPGRLTQPVRPCTRLHQQGGSDPTLHPPRSVLIPGDAVWT